MDISPLKLAYNKRNYHARKINSSCLLFAMSSSIEKMCTFIIQGDFCNWTPENVFRLRPWTLALDWSPYILLVLKPEFYSNSPIRRSRYKLPQSLSIEIIFTSSDTWTFFDHGGGGGAN